MNTRLDSKEISATIERLCHRIDERFEGSGLKSVAEDLLQLSLASVERSAAIVRPGYGVRIGTAAVVLLIPALFALALSRIEMRVDTAAVGVVEFVSALDAAMNVVVLVGAGLLFAVTVETRLKRKRALDALHELRSLVHVIDMHQLTKDPGHFLGSLPTASSPERTLSPFQLRRYLDYCTELLALTAKVAAVYGQSIQDREVLAGVSELESLCTDLSRKIWQKIALIIDTRGAPELST
jgi:hypothetical protein